MKNIVKLSSLILVFLISVCTSSVQAQSKSKTPPHATPKTTKTKAKVNYSVSWGPDLKMKGSFPNRILLYSNGNFYATTNSWSSSFISKINSNMELVLQNKVETQESDKSMSKHRLDMILEFNKGIWYITREKDKDNKKIVYFIEEVNLTTLESKGVKKKIYEVDYSVDKKREDVNPNFLTPEGKDALVIYDNHEVKKHETIQLTVMALDKSFSKIWKKDIEMPLQQDKNFDFEKYIDPSGNLYLLAKVYHTEKKKKEVIDGELTYDYHIYMIGKDVSSYVDYPFELKDKAVSQIELGVNKQNELTACGFYSDIRDNKDKITSRKGVFFTIIDPATKTIKAQSYKNFDNDIFTAGLSVKRASKLEEKFEEGKREGDASDYRIKELIPRKDGGSTMIAEEYYSYTVTIRSANGGSSSTTHYVYKNIIVTKINASGEIEWTSVIPKHADVTSNTLVCSYLDFDEGNDTYDFFFNDHVDNLMDASLTSKGVKEINDRGKKIRFVRVVVNPDGSMTKREVAFKMDEDDEKTLFYPTVSTSVSDHELILYGVDRGKDKFAKITYTDLEQGTK